MACTYPESLAAVAAQSLSWTKIVVFDDMAVFLALLLVKLYRQGDATVTFIDQRIVIETVVLAVDRHQSIRRRSFGVAEIIDDSICDTGVISEILLGGPK